MATSALAGEELLAQDDASNKTESGVKKRRFPLSTSHATVYTSSHTTSTSPRKQAARNTQDRYPPQSMDSPPTWVDLVRPIGHRHCSCDH